MLNPVRIDGCSVNHVAVAEEIGVAFSGKGYAVHDNDGTFR